MIGIRWLIITVKIRCKGGGYVLPGNIKYGDYMAHHITVKGRLEGRLRSAR